MLGSVEAGWAAAHHTDLGGLLLCGELLVGAWGWGKGQGGLNSTPTPLSNQLQCRTQDGASQASHSYFLSKLWRLLGSLFHLNLKACDFTQNPPYHT